MTYTYFNPAPSTLDELKAMYRKLAIATGLGTNKDGKSFAFYRRLDK